MAASLAPSPHPLQVTEADVNLAETFGASIIGFNVGSTRKSAALAEELGVPIQRHDIIYELTDGVKDMLDAAIEPVLEEELVGSAEVQQLFTLTLNRKDRKEGMKKSTQVAGLRVSSGEATTSARVRVTRGDEVIHVGSVVTIRHYKNEVCPLASRRIAAAASPQPRRRMPHHDMPHRTAPHRTRQHSMLPCVARPLRIASPLSDPGEDGKKRPGVRRHYQQFQLMPRRGTLAWRTAMLSGRCALSSPRLAALRSTLGSTPPQHPLPPVKADARVPLSALKDVLTFFQIVARKPGLYDGYDGGGGDSSRWRRG